MSNIRAFTEVIKKLGFILTGKQRRKSLLCLIFSLGSGILETLGIAVIMPFLYALLTPEALRSKPYIATAMKVLHIESDFGMIAMLGVFIVIIYFLKNAIL